jgi:hypothetical protein
MSRRAIACFLAAAAATGQAAAQQDLTPQLVSALLDAKGPPGPAWHMPEEGLAPILTGIGNGDPAWLALAPRLKGGGNAGFNESLPIALSRALQHNPAAVLRLLGPDFPPAVICRDNEIDPQPGAVRAYYAATIPAVRNVTDQGLAAMRGDCLAKLVASGQRHTDASPR